MIKCLYITGQVWLSQADQSINLNLMSNIENENGYVTIEGPRFGPLKIFTEMSSIELLAECERQATQQLMYSAGMEMENEN